jgi:hypothetical protein
LQERRSTSKLVQSPAQARSRHPTNQIPHFIGIVLQIEQQLATFAANQFQVALNRGNAIQIKRRYTYEARNIDHALRSLVGG